MFRDAEETDVTIKSPVFATRISSPALNLVVRSIALLERVIVFDPFVVLSLSVLIAPVLDEPRAVI